MKLKDQTAVICNLAFSVGVLETLMANYPVPENAKAGAKEAHKRLSQSLKVIMDEPVTY